jgi:hypothetical protein
MNIIMILFAPIYVPKIHQWYLEDIYIVTHTIVTICSCYLMKWKNNLFNIQFKKATNEKLI